MYYAKHTQTGEESHHWQTFGGTLYEVVEKLAWEDCEWELWEITLKGVHAKAEFPCTYRFHYGEESYTCELTANRPDSLCPFHAGEED